MIKNVHESLLLDYYGSLLTERQRTILGLYFDCDVSLSEIAEQENSSRQAIYDTVRKSVNLLKEYENKLGFMKRDEEMRGKIKSLIKQLEQTNMSNEEKLQNAISILEKML